MAALRIVDHVMYWLAFLHFGRIQGIGIPCKGPGVCDQATKATWAIIRSGPGGDVRDRRDHVVEPRDSPPAGQTGSFSSSDCATP